MNKTRWGLFGYFHEIVPRMMHSLDTKLVVYTCKMEVRYLDRGFVGDRNALWVVTKPNPPGGTIPRRLMYATHGPITDTNYDWTSSRDQAKFVGWVRSRMIYGFSPRITHPTNDRYWRKIWALPRTGCHSSPPKWPNQRGWDLHPMHGLLVAVVTLPHRSELSRHHFSSHLRV